jgi:four helix bundle protein
MEKEKSTFEDLEVWQKGRALRNGISNLTKTFPEEEKYKLANQMIRASRSVTANISEGYGRFHFQENIQFCRQARGSLFELIDHLTVALDEKYIEESEFSKIKRQIFEVIRILNGYIKYLKGRKNTGD